MSALSHPDADFDVVIVGGGVAGLSAGFTAAISEAQVLVVTAGGQRRHDAGAVLALPVEGEDWVTALHAKKEDLVQISRALPVVRRWVCEILESHPGLSVVRHPGSDGIEWVAGQDLFDLLKNWLESELLSRHNTRLEKGGLVSEVHTTEGRVIGVSVVDDTGKRRRIRTPRVVLCTGGISGLFFEDHETESGTALCVAGAVGARFAKSGALVALRLPASGHDPNMAPMREDDALRQNPMGFYLNIPIAGDNGEVKERGSESAEHLATGAGDSEGTVRDREVTLPLGYCGIVDVDATGETTVEGLYLCGLARGWGPFGATLAGIPLLNALISGVISGQFAATSPPDPALSLGSDDTESKLCTDTLLPPGFAVEKRRRLARIMRGAFFGFPAVLDRGTAMREVLKLRGEARDFKRFREIPELWRLYHSCEAALILLGFGSGI